MVLPKVFRAATAALLPQVRVLSAKTGMLPRPRIVAASAWAAGYREIGAYGLGERRRASRTVTPGAIQAVDLAAFGCLRRARHRRGELLRHVAATASICPSRRVPAERRHVDTALHHRRHQAREAGG
jgi:hypothetical protein